MTPAHGRTAHFREPQNDPHFFLNDQQKAFLRGIARVSRTRPVTVGLRGPTGGGKTSIPEWFAANARVPGEGDEMTKRPFFVLDCPTVREPKDVFGFKDVARDVDDDGNVHQRIVWRKSGFVHAIQTPNAVVVLDEATRIHPSAMNGLMPLLDHRRMVYIDELDETIEVADGVIFFLTANIGLEYTGTWAWDKALENRIDYQLDVGYLDATNEQAVIERKTGISTKLAKQLVDIARVIRDRARDENDSLSQAVSLRQLLAAAELAASVSMDDEAELMDALEFTIVPNYSDEGGTGSDRATVVEIIRGKLAPGSKK